MLSVAVRFVFEPTFLKDWVLLWVSMDAYLGNFCMLLCDRCRTSSIKALATWPSYVGLLLESKTFSIARVLSNLLSSKCSYRSLTRTSSSPLSLKLSYVLNKTALILNVFFSFKNNELMQMVTYLGIRSYWLIASNLHATLASFVITFLPVAGSLRKITLDISTHKISLVSKICIVTNMTGWLTYLSCLRFLGLQLIVYSPLLKENLSNFINYNKLWPSILSII